MNNARYRNATAKDAIKASPQQMGNSNGKLSELRNSAEITGLFTAFAEAQKEAILLVLSTDDEKERNTLAARITEDVNALFEVKRSSLMSGPKCPPGTKFNPETGLCEPMLAANAIKSGPKCPAGTKFNPETGLCEPI